MLEQAPKDCLTGFFSREALEPFLDEILSQVKLKKNYFSIALIDLDHFKKFNDKYGHLFGDEVLKYASSTLKLTFFAKGYQIFRYGGDEFIVAFVDTDPKEVLRLVRQCIYNLLRRPFLLANKFYKVTFSCGIAIFPNDAKTKEELIKKADEAMYFAKRHGRNRIVLASKIKFLKLRGLFLFFLIAAVIGGVIALVYKLSFKVVIQPTVDRMKDLKITTKPENLDTLILKNGGVFEGRILSEAEDKVVLNVYFDKEEGTIVFNKSEIAQIKYGGKEALEKK